MTEDDRTIVWDVLTQAVRRMTRADDCGLPTHEGKAVQLLALILTVDALNGLRIELAGLRDDLASMH